MAQPAKKMEQAAPGVAAAPKRDMWGLFTFFLIFLNLVALGGVAYFNKLLWSKVAELNTQVDQIARAAEPVEEASPVGSELQPKNFGVQFPLDGFLVNLASNSGPKFLQVQMQFELSSPGVEEELVRKKAVVRDAVISLLTSRSYQELRKSEGLQQLRNDIKGRVNNLLATGKIRQVFFTQFHFN